MKLEKCSTPWLTDDRPKVRLMSYVGGQIGVVSQNGSLYKCPGGEWASGDSFHALQKHLQD